MQMVANGYGMTLLPRVAVDVELRDERVKLLRFADPAPGRTVGLAWRRTSPRKADFVALGQLITETLGVASRSRRPETISLGGDGEIRRRFAALPAFPHRHVGRLDVAGEAHRVEQRAGVAVGDDLRL